MPMADFLLEHFWVNSRTSVEVNNYRQPMWPVATVLPYLIYPPTALQLFLEKAWQLFNPFRFCDLVGS